MAVQSLQIPRTAGARGAMSDRMFSVLLIAPAMGVILVFALFPLLYALDVSFRFGDLTRGQIVVS